MFVPPLCLFPRQIVVLDKLDYCSSLRNTEELANHTNFMFVKGDIASADLVEYILKTENIDTVMHFAAQVRSPVRRIAARAGTRRMTARQAWMRRGGCIGALRRWRGGFPHTRTALGL